MALGGAPGKAQKLDPIKWSLSVEPGKAPPGGHVLATLTAELDPGWHLYAPTTPRGGPMPTRITLGPNEAIDRAVVYQQPPTVKFDKVFNLNAESYENKAAFLLDAQLAKTAAAGPLELTAQLRYQVCSDTTCLPHRRSVSTRLIIDTGAPARSASIPPGFVEAKGPSAPAVAAAQPVTPAAPAGNQGIIPFLLVAFGFGLAAIFTPCVFPMIPITVSFFLNQKTAARRESVVQAVVFCLGIIVLFSLLGLVTTAILGPFGVVQLGSNPWVNTFIALVFLAFGLSLLGAFEITLPSSLLTSLDHASQKGGIFGTLLMGLTFSLTSFACVGPFVGTLLAASVQSGGVQPLLGMVSFATGLAAPFFLLALFPSYLQRLPKSGGWLARVKVVLGFVILAAMFKYLSNIDQVLQWNILTRERFLAVWIVLFALPGLYLLGFLRLEGVRADETVGLGRLLTGVAFLVFAVSLIPGMFGARLGELDAYVPSASSSSAMTSVESGRGSLAWMKNQYKEALVKARQEGKFVFVNFTGYACTNCHWMKANMFTRPEIASALNDFILVELYTDGVDDTSRLNQELQEKKFSTVAIPYYAILDPDEKVIATFPSLTRNPEEFLTFLQTARHPATSSARLAAP
jgi:thiol:disulfide interchange protein